jgi:hypothetical protein
MTTTISPMLRLFQEGAATYQPDGLALESGDPQVSLENIRRLMATGLVIRDILVGSSGVLVLFRDGEQFYATGLRVGTNNSATEALARIAAEASFGPFERLLPFYQHLPASYSGQLPDVFPEPTE